MGRHVLSSYCYRTRVCQHPTLSKAQLSRYSLKSHTLTLQHSHGRNKQLTQCFEQSFDGNFACYCVKFSTALPTQPLHFSLQITTLLSQRQLPAHTQPHSLKLTHTLCRLESCWCLMSTSLLGNCLLQSKQASLFQSVSLSSLALAFLSCSSRCAGGWGGGSH